MIIKINISRSNAFKENSIPSAKCYADKYESWITNSSSIKANAALSWIASYLEFNYNTRYAEPDLNKDGKIDILDLIKMKNVL